MILIQGNKIYGELKEEFVNRFFNDKNASHTLPSLISPSPNKTKILLFYKQKYKIIFSYLILSSLYNNFIF